MPGLRLLAVLSVLAVLVGAAPAADAQKGLPGEGQPWDFTVLFSQGALNRAALIEQVEEDTLGQRSTINGGINTTNNTTSNQATAAESLSQIMVECGDDVQCQVDAAFNGTSSGTATATTTGGGTNNSGPVSSGN